MNVLSPRCDTDLEVDRVLRWSIYHRLLQLEIPCTCASDRPLQMEIGLVADAIQAWCVIRQFVATRKDGIQWLEHCWQKV